jgi:hypothetical protein
MKGMYNKKITNHATIEYEVERVVERLKKVGKNEEKIIDTFAYGINQVIQDNKENLFGATENNNGKED